MNVWTASRGELTSLHFKFTLECRIHIIQLGIVIVFYCSTKTKIVCMMFVQARIIFQVKSLIFPFSGDSKNRVVVCEIARVAPVISLHKTNHKFALLFTFPLCNQSPESNIKIVFFLSLLWFETFKYCRYFNNLSIRDKKNLQIGALYKFWTDYFYFIILRLNFYLTNARIQILCR